MTRKQEIFLLMACLLTIPASVSAMPEIDSLWNYDNPKASEAKFRSLLPQAQSADLNYYLELQTQIARALGLQRKFTEAHSILDDVSNHLPPEPCVCRIRYLLERGRVYNTSGQVAKAVPLFLQALKQAKQISADYYAIDAAHMLGIVASVNTQLDWNLEALSIAEKSKQPESQQWLGSLYNNIGWTYHDQKNYSQALSYFEKSADWHRTRKTGEGEMIAEWTVARALRSLGKIEAALERQQALMKTRFERKLPDDGYVFEEIGECLLAMNKKNEASPYFAKAWKLLSQDSWLRKNESARLQRLKSMGQVK